MAKKRILGFILILLAILVLGSCRLLETEQRSTLSEHTYSFDSDTILQDLESNGFNVFTPINNSQMPDIENYRPVVWTPDEYYAVLNLLHTHIWNDDPEQWEIGYVSFVWDCAFLSYGPQKAHITYFKNEKDYRLSSELFVNPSLNFSIGTRLKYYPRAVKLDGIDFYKLILSPEEILSIAEENGGFAKRELHENDCQIDAFYNISLFDGWQVMYSPSDGYPLNIKINPTSGEIVSDN